MLHSTRGRGTVPCSALPGAGATPSLSHTENKQTNRDSVGSTGRSNPCTVLFSEQIAYVRSIGVGFAFTVSWRLARKGQMVFFSEQIAYVWSIGVGFAFTVSWRLACKGQMLLSQSGMLSYPKKLCHAIRCARPSSWKQGRSA
jgi:hypothetical protein